jgi:hypothetical protein
MHPLAGRKIILLPLGICAALVLAAVAAAWSDSYVNNATFWAADSGHSGYNSNLAGNALSVTNAWGDSPTLGSRYINSDGEGLNAYEWRGASFIDYRTVSYGAAQCTANAGNGYPLYVYQCYTEN